MILLYILAGVILLIAAVLMLRLRLRLRLSGDQRLLFVGLGRSGPQLDFITREGEVRIAGVRVWRFDMDKEEPATPPEKPAKPTPVVQEPEPSKPTEPAPKKTLRGRLDSLGGGVSLKEIREVLDIVPAVARALFRYMAGLLKSVIVEQAEGEIEGGFEEPHVTGQVYGCYQAVAAMAPGLIGRVNYIPTWAGAQFDGSMQVSVALPLYQVVGRTVVLIWRLPKLKIVRMIRESRREKSGKNPIPSQNKKMQSKTQSNSQASDVT